MPAVITRRAGGYTGYDRASFAAAAPYIEALARSALLRTHLQTWQPRVFCASCETLAQGRVPDNLLSQRCSSFAAQRM